MLTSVSKASFGASLGDAVGGGVIVGDAVVGM